MLLKARDFDAGADGPLRKFQGNFFEFSTLLLFCLYSYRADSRVYAIYA